MSEEQTPYRVLARKYRPQNFDDLIGQDALVRTLKNAIESGRIAHAFMLTGIRGVGKTTTARIIAKALNYTGADGNSGPTTGPTDDCEICQAIAEDRHPDILEMDAASRTGIDDIREILDGVRYAPTSARYKIYIIDEVHMLSKAAFNALLKTLEEPPEHVKFIFATTEIRKVPVTVLSRCQRFDLRRIETPVLADYYSQIAEKEKVKTEPDALSLIARAADGSVRDGLSLLDQAIALGDGNVTQEQVKDMLGLADRALVLDILDRALGGEISGALDIMGDLYKKGADPVVVLQDLLELAHILTKKRALPANDQSAISMVESESERINDMANKLSMPTLGRTWQILLKSLNEVNAAPNAQQAAEMVIIRLAYATDLPDPADLLKKIETSGAPGTSVAPANNAASARTAPQTPGKVTNLSPAAEPVQNPTPAQPQAALQQHHQTNDEPGKLETVADIVNLLQANGEMILASHVRSYVHLVKLAPQSLEFRAAEHAPPRLSQDLSGALKAFTGERWVITLSNKQGEETLAQAQERAATELRDQILQAPLAKNILKLFPDAQLKDIKS
ncbi:MAG: DNA polymerase III subunit gamma/tau [Alphaproteobacteria bacterium]|nr:DNA polymerase III subunit gamma/tau [Alphaproteobacteria bacterium]